MAHNPFYSALELFILIFWTRLRAPWGRDHAELNFLFCTVFSAVLDMVWARRKCLVTKGQHSPFTYQHWLITFSFHEKMERACKGKVKVTQSCRLFCDPIHGILQEHSRILEWIASCSLLQGIFPTQGSNPGLPHCRQTLYPLSHQGSYTVGPCLFILYILVCVC